MIQLTYGIAQFKLDQAYMQPKCDTTRFAFYTYAYMHEHERLTMYEEHLCTSEMCVL